MKKYFKFVILALILLVFIGTFMFLYQKSKPKVIVFLSNRKSPVSSTWSIRKLERK